MLLLAIDTATPTITAGVVSLLRPHEIIDIIDAGGAAEGVAGPVGPPIRLLAERRVTDPFGHAEKLMPLVVAALAESGFGLGDVDAIVAGLGPGPFTGLRVGLATAQALGDALDRPVYGVGSHDAAARAHVCADAGGSSEVVGVADTGGAFLVVTDARRREVYLSAYAADGRRLLGPLPLSPAAVAETLAEGGVRPTHMIGAGVHLVELAGVPAGEKVVGSISSGLVLAAARSLLTAAVPGPLTPLYLRRPDATEPGRRKSVLGS